MDSEKIDALISSETLTEKDFGFTKNELELLFCVNFYATNADASAQQSIGMVSSIFSGDDAKGEKALDIKNRKTDWLRQWADVTKSLLDVELRYEGQALVSRLQSQMGDWSVGKRSAFIVEAVTFAPYFPLSKEDKSSKGLSSNDDVYFLALSQCFAIEDKELLAIRKTYGDAHKTISRLCTGSGSKMMWIGIASALALIVAPYLAVSIGGLMGLSGAAATSAGLAFLGGGSLAAGGFGMAGGYMAIMAGGAILGHQFGSSSDRTRAAKYSADELLVSCAKLKASLYATYGNDKTDFGLASITHFCESARQLQAQFESLADAAYLDDDEKEGKRQGKKAAILVAFRRYLREK